jgi:hypothetical protein
VIFLNIQIIFLLEIAWNKSTGPLTGFTGPVHESTNLYKMLAIQS